MNRIAPLDPLQLPLRGIQLIEASAGTGKTWTIAALYLRLVLGHDNATPLLPPQILVVTFTKAATAELRERIRTRLGEAAEAFRGRGAADDFLAALVAEYSDTDARARAARQLELAAQWMDEAAVYTIHGWCQRMLSQHAFDSGHAFVQTASSDESELLAEAVRDYWRQQFFALDRADAAHISALWKTPQDLQVSLHPLLRQPAENLRLDGNPLPVIADLPAAMTTMLSPLREAEQHARSLWLADTAAIEALLMQAMQSKVLSGATYKSAQFAGDMTELQRWAEGDVLGDDKSLSRYAQRKLTASTNKNKETPKHPAFAAIDALLDAQHASQSLKSLILAHAVPWVAARLDASKQRLAQLGYDDMLTRLDSALHGSSGERLAQTIATQYPVALIDEFQDTDPLQWRIFRRIYATRIDTALLLIGDPKQAIYGFRGADIHTYLHARSSAAKPTWTLATNYRSTGPMVSAVNRVFEFAEQHPQGAFLFGKGEHGLPFLPVQAQGRKERLLLHGEPLPALQLVVAAAAAPISKNAYQTMMATHAAATLVHWLDAARHGNCDFVDNDGKFTALVPGDIAILVRKGSEATEMRDALQARGLASVYLSDRDSVYDSPEAHDLLLWLHACAEPGSDRAMRAALASYTLGQSYAELDRLNLDEQHWERYGERFRQLHDSWLRHGVLAMLHDLLHLFDLPAQLLARSDGERALTNLLHLAELLQQAAATLDGEHALIRHLASQIAQAGDHQADTADEQIVRLESEAALIKVITIHKSKGLEYPLVLLPFVCGLRETKLTDSFVWHGPDGQPTLDLQPTHHALEQAERERLQEDLRLLYVALTRARHACWLGIADLKDGQKKASGLHKSAFGYVLSGGQPIEEAALLTRLEELRNGHPDVHIENLTDTADTRRYQPVAETRPDQPAREYRGQPVEPWWIASYSALKVAAAEYAPRQAAPETAQQDVHAEAGAERIEPYVSVKPDGTPSIHTFPRGAEPGTFLHGLLEWAADEGFAASAMAPAALMEVIAHRCQRRGWQDWSNALSTWLPAFLNTPLSLPAGGAAALADAHTYRPELEFWFEANRVDTQALDRLVTVHTLDACTRPPLLPDHLNGMLKGFIDLVLEHDGRYYIVDYKSNWLGGDASAYGVEAMRDSVLHSRYDLQYAIYTLALHRQLRARLPDYDYARHVGGVLYLYLRGVDGEGHGVHREHLPFALIDAMDQLFAQEGLHDAA